MIRLVLSVFCFYFLINNFYLLNKLMFYYFVINNSPATMVKPKSLSLNEKGAANSLIFANEKQACSMTLQSTPITFKSQPTK